MRRQLTWIVESGTDVDVPAVARPRSHTYLGWGLELSLAVVVGLVTGFAAWNLKPPPPWIVTRLSLNLAPGDQFASTCRRLVDLSPDGTHLVYVANRQLYLRAMDQMESIPIPLNGEVSPDSRWLAYQSDELSSAPFFSGGGSVLLGESLPHHTESPYRTELILWRL